MDGIPPRRPDRTISADEAQRRLPELLGTLDRDGALVVVDADGKPLARLEPAATVAAEDEAARRKAAFHALVAAARQRPFIAVGPWTRDELYEDER